MKFDKEEIKQPLQITLVFVVIVGIFSLLGRLNMFIRAGVNKENIVYFFQDYMLWLIVIMLVILGICIYIKKTDGKFNLTFIHNPTVRLTSGLFIILDGILTLPDKITILLLNIQPLLHPTSNNVNFWLLYVTPIIISLLQILFGLYFIFNRKMNSRIE